MREHLLNINGFLDNYFPKEKNPESRKYNSLKFEIRHPHHIYKINYLDGFDKSLKIIVAVVIVVYKYNFSYTQF